NRLVKEAFQEPPASFDEVTKRYAELLAAVDQEWKSHVEQAKQKGEDRPVSLSDAERDALRRVLYGPSAACEVPDQPIVHTETFFDSATCTELWKLQGEVDRWIIQAKADVP